MLSGTDFNVASQLIGLALISHAKSGKLSTGLHVHKTACVVDLGRFIAERSLTTHQVYIVYFRHVANIHHAYKASPDHQLFSWHLC